MLYEFKTDSESGDIEAATFQDACQQLDKMLPARAVADGGWGWVEDEDGYRYEINCEGH